MNPPFCSRVLCFLLVLVVCGCGPKHIGAFTPKNREYNTGRYAAADAKPTPGSLYSETVPGFLQDTRAVRVGDVVVVRVDENADAKGDATTKLSKSATRQEGATALLGLLPALQRSNPDMDPSRLVALASQVDFSGDGQTHRKGQLTGSIAVRVKQQMPNGDLYVEGTKVVLINNEEYHLYVSGLVRPADVGPDNSVASSRVADAQVEFTGRGDIADTVDRGWLTKLLDAITPF